MHYHRICAALSLLVGVTLAACGTPYHTNTLIFSTGTKIALDISADPTSGNPSISVGYKRLEVVWMPLLANKDDQGTPYVDKDFLFLGKEDGKAQDTYSVIATIDAKFSSGAEQSKLSAGGGLAQFFATGLAARKLAALGGAKLVSVQPDAALSEETKTNATTAKINNIAAYVQTKEGKVDPNRLNEVLKGTGLENYQPLKDLSGQDIGKLKDTLRGTYIDKVDAVAGNIK
jgi:hypothetical protein